MPGSLWSPRSLSLRPMQIVQEHLWSCHPPEPEDEEERRLREQVAGSCDAAGAALWVVSGLS
jgi:hypothetical protein